MKSVKLLKTALLLCATFLSSSCLLPEDVVDVNTFQQPVKIISVSPDSAFVGDDIIITGENFILQKEYNQVWFGGNIKAAIDSATSTKLFLKVPAGGKSGVISVSNGVYYDTLKAPFTVNADSPFKMMSMSFGGFKTIKFYWYSGYNGSQGDFSGSGNDSTVLNKKIDSLVHSRSFAEQVKYELTRRLGFCWPDPMPIISDSAFVSRKYGTGSHTVISEISIDSINSTFTKVAFWYVSQDGRAGDTYGSGERYCRHFRFNLMDVPYTKNKGKKVIALKGEEIKKYLISYYQTDGDFMWTQGRTNSRSESNYSSPYAYTPDAYFELTLE